MIASIPRSCGCSFLFPVPSHWGLCRRTDDNGTLGDHGAVSLVDNVVDELEIVRVRDDLVIGEDVLWKRIMLVEAMSNFVLF